MPSITTNDLRAIGEQIAAAVKDSLATDERPGPIRDQILANAGLLWHTFEFVSDPRPTPTMAIVIPGTSPNVRGYIVRTESGVEGQPRIVFMQSVGSESASDALHKLLRMTMIGINFHALDLLKFEGGSRLVDGYGTVYMPPSRRRDIEI
ncbi:hypothetical protein LTR53_015215 [Teratosphaeriaceae sp. CCFEE 6253]|nr:hypothetical protein LTR53_015215 [Teratosphaeriaceae sp. CCFEE 6253]